MFLHIKKSGRNISFYEAFDRFQADNDVNENDEEIFSTCAVAIWLGAAIKQQKYNSHILPYVL